MQHQFKPGDLALTLVDCGIVAAGSVVEFVRTMPAGEEFIMRGSEHSHDYDTALVIRGGERFLYRHDELMPLRDDHAPQSEKQKELTHG